MARAFLQSLKVPENIIAPFRLNTFYGGLNNVYSPLLLEDSESPNLLNVIFDEKGILKKRKGYTKFLSYLFPTVPKKMFIYAHRAPSTRRFYLFSSETKLYKMEIGVDTDPVELKNVSGVIDGVVYQDKFLFVDGAGYFEYNGDAILQIIEPPHEHVTSLTNSASTTLAVNDAKYFYANQQIEIHDHIDNSLVVKTISSVDYGTNTITLTEAVGKDVEVEDMIHAYVTNQTGLIGNEYTYAGATWYAPCKAELDDLFKGKNLNITDSTIIALNNERVYLSGSEVSPNLVNIADLNNYKYIPANTFVPPISNDGDYVTGLKVYMDTLVIFKRYSVFALYGNNPDVTGVDPFSLKRVNVESGTSAKDSICPVENYLYYLGSNGVVYSLYPIQTNVNYIMGKSMSEKLDLFKAPISIVYDDLSTATAIYHKGHYYLDINSKLTLVYDYRYQAWSLWKGLNATHFIIDKSTNKLLFLSTASYLYEHGTSNNDDGVKVEAFWESKWFDSDKPEAIKQFRKMYIISKTFQDYISKITIIFKVDFEEIKQDIEIKSQLSVWGTSEWGDRFITSDTVRSEPVSVQKRGKIMQIKITNDILDQPMALIEINGLIQIRPTRR